MARLGASSTPSPFKELKLELRGGEPLGGHTPERAAQEMLALLIASAVVADERLQSQRTQEANKPPER